MKQKMSLPDPNSIKQQILRWWKRGSLHRAYLAGESMFPLRWPLPTLSAKTLQTEYASIRAAVSGLITGSKHTKSHGYDIEYQTINHRRLGPQKIPSAIVFTNAEDLLRWLGCYGSFQQFCHCVALTRKQIPSLLPLIEQKPNLIMHYLDIWPQLLSVCQYFNNNPKPNVYMRELDIVGVDTKFIEQHQKILKQLLDFILPETCLQDKPNQLAQHGFERRFGLRYPEPLIRFRLLDQQLETPELPISDITIPLKEFAQLRLPCQHVFITENLINGLSFPKAKASIVIFGFGYGILSLAKASWLQKKSLHYWGDIDTHGFSILSNLRKLFPRLTSLLMDQNTWEQFASLRVTEAAHQRCLKELPYLTESEQLLYQNLLHLPDTEPNRLEQERLPFSYCLEAIKSIQYR